MPTDNIIHKYSNTLILILRNLVLNEYINFFNGYKSKKKTNKKSSFSLVAHPNPLLEARPLKIIFFCGFPYPDPEPGPASWRKENNTTKNPFFSSLIKNIGPNNDFLSLLFIDKDIFFFFSWLGWCNTTRIRIIDTDPGLFIYILNVRVPPHQQPTKFMLTSFFQQLV